MPYSEASVTEYPEEEYTREERRDYARSPEEELKNRETKFNRSASAPPRASHPRMGSPSPGGAIIEEEESNNAGNQQEKAKKTDEDKPAESTTKKKTTKESKK